MCCSGGQVAQTDQALQAAQAKVAETLNAHANITFAQQQAVQGQLRAKLDYMSSNPMGYSPQELHTAKSSINDNTARAAQQALGSAAAFAAAHGSADIGGGSVGQIAGQIGSEAAQSKAGQLAELSRQNEERKQQNMWSAISGLNQVGSEYGSSTNASTSGAVGSADSATTAGSGALAAKQAGWSNFTGVLGGIAGMATAASGFPKLGCWVASAIYGGWYEPRTVLVRSYIFGEFSTTWYGRALAWLYIQTGEWISKKPALVRMLTPVFNAALRKAQMISHGRQEMV